MRRAVMHLAVYLTLLAVSAPTATAQSMGELEIDHALTFEFPTPHTDWAQPYALGKIRVLFFTDGRGTNPRECVELMQRFDVEGQAVFYCRIVDSSKSHWHGGQTGEKRMLKLLSQQWDCYVFLGMDMRHMSSEQKVKLLEPVTKGAGLVLVGANDKEVLKAKNGIDPVPPFLAGEPAAAAYKVNRGRGVRLPGRPKIDYHEGWELDYDYWQERLGRAVLWAAGKPPKLQLGLLVPKASFDRSGPAIRLKLLSEGSCRGANPKLHVRVRRRVAEPIVLPTRPFRAGEHGEVTLPKLPAGEYHVDAQVIGAAGVEGWVTRSLEVVSSRSVQKVVLAQDWGEIGGTIAGTVTVAGPPLPGETLRVRLLDRRRRELLRKDLKPQSGTSDFELPIGRWMPMLITVEAVLLEGSAEVSRAYAYFRVTKRHHGQWNFLIWDTPRGTLAPYAEESLARHGMTLQLTPGNPPLHVAAFEAAWVPYTTRIMTPKTKEGVMKPFCWNDEQAVAAHVTAKAKAYLPAAHHGVFVWSLGDEVMTQGCCLSPHCQRAYWAYLKEVYGGLDAVNRSWGTEFKSWDQVGVSKPGDNEEANSLRQKNYPRWYDRQAFKSYNFVQLCRKYAKAYEAVDPKAKTGFEGAGRLEKGDDIDLIVRTNKFWSPYPGMADEVIRSIAPRAFPRANWMGYTKDADSLLQKYWRMVTRGCDSVWWWRWDCIGRFHGWLAPDFRPFPAVAEIIRDTQILRDGLGDLLIRSTMLDDGIASLFSHPSVYAHRLAEGGTYGGYLNSHRVMHDEVIRELGLQFRYVTDRMLRLGEFDASRYKVLLLIRAEAIGDKEATVIRKFVEGGGTVLADVRPGVYDGHCRPRDRGVLDDLFGVERRGRAGAKTAIAQIGGSDGFAVSKAKVDPSVKLAGGKALGRAGEVPVGIVRQVGKGRAILLNFSADGYPGLQLPETPESAATFIYDHLARAGVRPAILVRDGSGKRLRNFELTRWRNGDIDIASLFREGGKRAEATMSEAPQPFASRIPTPRHVYDLRQRKALGQKKSWTTTIIPNRATFFVLCRNAVPQPQIKLDRTTVDRGQIVKATMVVPKAEGLHVYRICVGLCGTPLECHDRNVVVGREPVTFEIPVAYNDPAGAYEVRAIDLFTNAATTARLTVK